MSTDGGQRFVPVLAAARRSASPAHTANPEPVELLRLKRTPAGNSLASQAGRSVPATSTASRVASRPGRDPKTLVVASPPRPVEPRRRASSLAVRGVDAEWPRVASSRDAGPGRPHRTPRSDLDLRIRIPAHWRDAALIYGSDGPDAASASIGRMYTDCVAAVLEPGYGVGRI
jgi:hypothetical protein